MHTFHFYFYYFAQLLQKQHLNIAHYPDFPLVSMIRKKKKPLFLQEHEPGDNISICFMAYIKKKNKIQTEMVHTQEKYPHSAETSPFAMITFLFLNCVILR